MAYYVPGASAWAISYRSGTISKNWSIVLAGVCASCLRRFFLNYEGPLQQPMLGSVPSAQEFNWCGPGLHNGSPA